MPNQQVRIEGIEELTKQLKQLPDKMKRSDLLKILRAGSKVVVERAKHELAQVMEKGFSEGRYPTGNLYDSIGHITGRSTDYPNVQVGARVKRGFKGYHAHWVNYGTAIRKNRKGSNRGAGKANPFMKNAFEGVSTQVAQNLTGAVAKYLERKAKETIIPKY